MADTQSVITCPACDKEMTKVYIDDLDIHVDICKNGCGGIFFDNRELDKFDEKHENADKILNELKEKTYEPVNDTEVRICPVCNRPMVKIGTKAKGVTIDQCYTCGSKFLDNGELEKIREAEKPEREKLLYRTEEEERVHKEEMHEILGKNANKPYRQSWGRNQSEKIVKFFMGL